jgi:flagellar basal-body rod protein FlgC
MTMSSSISVFDVAGRAMSAQLVRLNTITSNIAQAGAVAGSEAEAFRAIRPVFGAVYSETFRQDGLAAVSVDGVVPLEREPKRMHRPDHPLADAEGYVYEAAVNVDEEMVEMLEATRQYQNTVEVVSTLRTLMARTVEMGQ